METIPNNLRKVTYMPLGLKLFAAFSKVST
jgi:hypothetical protein